MLCPYCDKDTHPSVEMRDGSTVGAGATAMLSGRFCYICAACQGVIGPTKPAVVPTPKSAIPAAPISTSSLADKSVGLAPSTDYVAVLHARLEWVESQITAQTELRAERKRLQRMLAAAGAKSAPRARIATGPSVEPDADESNVLPLRSAVQ